MTLGPNGIDVPHWCEPARRLYIGVPSYTARPCLQHSMSMLQVGVVLTHMGVEVVGTGCGGVGYIDHARNILVTRFLESNCTDLLLWDDDVGADVAAIAKIVLATRPFVGGNYLKKTDGIEWAGDFEPGPVYADADGLIETPRTVPTGFLRLNRVVFDVLPSWTYSFEGGERFCGYFESRVGHGGDGEDVDLCNRWRQRGGKCYVIPDLNLSHTGSKTWDANLKRYLQGTLDDGRSRIPQGHEPSGFSAGDPA